MSKTGLSATRARIAKGHSFRPRRKSIFDNLSPEQQMLWEVFCLDSQRACEAEVYHHRIFGAELEVPATVWKRHEPRLRVRRARRLPDVYRVPFWSENHFYNSGGALERRRIDDRDAVEARAWVHDWQSPAQRGRAHAKREYRSVPRPPLDITTGNDLLQRTFAGKLQQVDSLLYHLTKTS